MHHNGTCCFHIQVGGEWCVTCAVYRPAAYQINTVVVALKMEKVYRSNVSYLQTSLHVRLTKSENYEQSLL